MRNLLKYILAYFLWFVDLLLAGWLAFIGRTALFAVPALFFHRGSIFYAIRAEVIDTVFTLIIGIGWFAFMVITLEYYQPDKQKGNLVKRFARITGPLVLGIFAVDLILFLLQGYGAGNWPRLLFIAVELLAGVLMVIYSRKDILSEPA